VCNLEVAACPGQRGHVSNVELECKRQMCVDVECVILGWLQE